MVILRALGLLAASMAMPAMAPSVAAQSVVVDPLTPQAADGSPAYAADWAFLLGAGR